MARKNCDRKNGKRLSFLKHWDAVGQRFLKKWYGNFILTPIVCKGTHAQCLYQVWTTRKWVLNYEVSSIVSSHFVLWHCFLLKTSLSDACLSCLYV